MEHIISNWISSELIDNITHTVIQSTWQGAIIAIVTFILFQWKGKQSPIIKYRIALLGVSSLFICALVTFLSSYMTGVTTDTSLVASNISEWTANVIMLDEGTLTLSNTWIGYLWIFGVTVFSIKFLMDIGIVQYIKYSAIENEESDQYKSILNSMQNELNTSVVLKVSKIVKAPVTIGFFKPIILFPIGMLTQLTLAEVDSILRHEMAHIVRKDYLINIIQSMMEIVLFYHPLVWWLSRVAREEREYCCDDAALTNTGEALDYAKTLVRIQELVIQQRQTLAMSFADQSLMNRIKRIMNLPKSNRNMREKLIAITAVLALLVFASKDMIASVTDKIWNAIEIENTDVPREAIELNMEMMSIDTLPAISKQSYSMTKSDDDGSISIKKENGKITKLEIDGKKIPESQYDQYQDEIDEMEGGNSRHGNVWRFSDGDVIDMDNLEEELESLGIEMEEWGEWFGEGFGEDFGKSMEEWGENFEQSFGKDMENWGERFGKSMENWGEQFGNRFEMHFEDGDSSRAYSFVMPEIDGDMMLELEDIIGGLDLEGLKMLELEGMTDELSEMLEGLDFDELRLKDLGNNRGNNRAGKGSSSTVEDKIGYELRKDRLIATGEVSEVELSGKHMKINGDKQPKNIWNKYKEIFEESSGIELSKDSKLKFKVEGKKTIKKSSSF